MNDTGRVVVTFALLYSCIVVLLTSATYWQFSLPSTLTAISSLVVSDWTFVLVCLFAFLSGFEYTHRNFQEALQNIEPLAVLMISAFLLPYLALGFGITLDVYLQQRDTAPFVEHFFKGTIVLFESRIAQLLVCIVFGAMVKLLFKRT